MDYKHIKEFRVKKGWSLREAADISGVSHMYIAYLESGAKKNPTVKVLVKLAKAYGIGIADILKGGCNC